MISPGKPALVETIPSRRSRWTYRRRGLSNLLKMGHCAPAVMKTILDLEGSQEEWLVRMTAGLPGGIGNTGYECGGLTSPLVKFGLDYGLSAEPDGLPMVFAAGHDYQRRFQKCHDSLLCKEILGERRVPMPCIKVVCLAPELYRQTDPKNDGGAVSGETREAFLLLYSHLSANDFHCAHAVLKQLGGTNPIITGTAGWHQRLHRRDNVQRPDLQCLQRRF